MGVETIHFGGLGRPGRYSGIHEGDFHVDSENPKVGHGGENFEKFRKVSKVTKIHVMTGNDQQSVWEYHLGVKRVKLCDLGCPGRYSGVLEGTFHVDSQNPNVGYGAEKFEIFIFF